jgi:hypothetical protein
VTLSTFHTEGPQIADEYIQRFVAREACPPEFLHPQSGQYADSVERSSFCSLKSADFLGGRPAFRSQNVTVSTTPKGPVLSMAMEADVQDSDTVQASLGATPCQVRR